MAKVQSGKPQVVRMVEDTEKQKALKGSIQRKQVVYNWHESKLSFLEAVFARGDRRLSKVMIKAHELGCKFDSWNECFEYEKWLQAFKECGIDPHFYANRKREFDEILPWAHLDYSVTKEFFIRQNELAHQEQTTPNCRLSCAACGANCYGEGVCFEKR